MRRTRMFPEIPVGVEPRSVHLTLTICSVCIMCARLFTIESQQVCYRELTMSQKLSAVEFRRRSANSTHGILSSSNIKRSWFVSSEF